MLKKFFLDLPISKKIYIPIIIAVLFSVALVSFISYISIKHIEKEVIDSISKDLENFFYLKLEEKKSVALTGSIIVSQNSVIKEALKNGNREIAIKELSNIAPKLKKYTKFKNIKIHLHTADVKSFLRTWKLKKYGDDLKSFRKTILYVKDKKIPVAAIELGKAGLILRGVAPVLDNGRYIGSVEFMQGLNSVALDLKNLGINTLIVFDKSYQDITEFLKNAPVILNKYVVAIKDYAYSPSYLKEISSSGFLNKYIKTKNYFAIKIPIKDFEGKIIAYAILAKNNSLIKQIIYKNIKALILQIIVMVLIDFLTLMAIFYIVYFYITRPIKELEDSLQSFFEFLKNPKEKIKKINIDSNDEIGKMAKMIKENIDTATYLHNEMANLMSLVDKNIIIIETDENGNIIKTSEAFKKLFGELNNKNVKEFILGVNWEEIDKYDFWEGEVKAKDFWLNVKIHKKCINDKECGYTIIGYDITDKKKFHELTLCLEERVKEKTKEVYLERELLKEANKKIKDSIKFASIIQKAILPKEELFKEFFEDYFIIWKPRDIVGGDIYFFEKIDENEAVLMVIDCTGHGVPGAFITMIIKAIEKEIINKIKNENIKSPAKVLEMFHEYIKSLLKTNEVGFDGGIVFIDKKNNTLKFAGSNTSLFYWEDEVKVIKGQRVSIGYKRKGKYKDYEILLNKTFYLTTDGYTDQVGGEKSLPLGKKRFKKLIEEIYDLPLSKQKELFLKFLEEYRKDNHQIDDITIIGFKT